MTSELTSFVAELIETQGLELLPWQREFVDAVGRPDVVTAGLSCARGNGKTTLLAAVAAAYAAGPLRQPGEVVIAASSFQQGRVLFKAVYAMLVPRLNTEVRGADAWQVSHSDQKAAMYHPRTGTGLRVISSSPKRAHGLIPSLVIADEPAQWETSSGRQLFAALETSLGKLPNAKLVTIGTRAASPDHWYSRELDGGFDYTKVWAAGEDVDVRDKAAWAAANPSLEYFPELRATIQREALRIERTGDADAIARFRALRLNAGVADVVEAYLVELDTWRGCEVDELPAAEGPLVLGVDLGTGHAMSAVAAYWPRAGRLEVFAAFPEVPDLAQRGRRDGVGDLYAEMAARGELLVLGERVVDIGGLLRVALDRWGMPNAIVADRWREAELRQALGRAGVPTRTALVVRGMGFKDGAADVREFRAAVADGRVRTRPSMLVRAAVGEARVVLDEAGNAKLSKKAQGGRRATAKDDAIAAAILAVAEGQREHRRLTRPARAAAVLGRI